MWSLWKTVGRFLRKSNTELPYDPAISLLGINSKKSTNSKRDRHPDVQCGIIYNSQDIEAFIRLSVQ